MGFTKEQALLAIDREKELLTTASDQIWDNPETAFQEFKSTEILCELLEKEGFAVEKNVANIATAFTGRFGSGKPVIGFLGEYDALSGLSQIEGIFEKKPLVDGAPGHGCGHNLLGVGSVAAALAVKEYLQENGKEGTVIFYGCPGEEGGSGKGFMARDGVFDELDFAVSWHPADQNAVSVGSSTANYQIYYRFYGISSHAAASPEKGRSALDAVELMNTGVQYLREHVIQEARIHYAITNTGGFSPIVVQPFAEVLYLIRAPKTSLVQEIYERINDIARGAALMTGTRMEMQFVKACSNLIDNTVLEEVMQKNLDELELPTYTEEEIAFAKQMADTYGGNKIDIQAVLTRYEKSKKASVEALLTPHIDDIISTAKVPLMDMEVAMAGSTDVSDVSWVCPTVQANICTLAAGTPGHSWQEVAQGKSTMAHKGMLYAGKVMAATAIDILESPETIEKAKEELAKRVGPEGYIAPIPKDVKPMAINPKK